MPKLIISYMIIHNLINIDLEQINLSININNTRANGLRLVFSLMLHSFEYTAGKMWNVLSMNFICASSLNSFKLRLSCICLDDL